MAWTCPDCGREFRNTRQWHSCASFSIGDHFRKRAPFLTDLFESLCDLVRRNGPFETSPVKTAIQLRQGATFLSVSVKPDHLRLEFQLPYRAEGISIEKCVPVSANRWFHIAVIDEPADLEGVLSTWIADAYRLVVGNNQFDNHKS